MSDSSQRPPRSLRAAARPSPDRTGDLNEARALYAQLDPAWFEEANDPKAWLFEPAVQELIAQVVDAEVAPFAALLGPEELRVLRDEVELALHSDPVAIEYLDRVRPRGARDQSSKVKKNVLRGADILALRARKAGGEKP